MAKEMGDNCSMPYLEDDVAAGVHDLERFGHTGTLIEYAKAFGVKRWGDVLDYGFNEVYVYLWRETVKERINKKRADNMNKNNK